MNCERCGEDAPVSHHDVDGFAYYLCVSCAEEWEAVRDATTTVESAGQSPAR
jgi:formate dehydrogenase maturation protein FdhE